MQGFQNVLKLASDLGKVGDCEMVINGQKLIILTRVTSNILSTGQQNSGGYQLSDVRV